jgi:hypothetical protein
MRVPGTCVHIRSRPCQKRDAKALANRIPLQRGFYERLNHETIHKYPLDNGSFFIPPFDFVSLCGAIHAQGYLLQFTVIILLQLRYVNAVIIQFIILI